MKTLTFFLCMIGFSLQGEDIHHLIKRVRPESKVRSHIESTLKIAKELKVKNSRDQLYNHLQRMLQYASDFPLLKEGEYLPKQSHLIWMAAKALKQEEELDLSDYPTANHHTLVYFIFDLDTGDRIGVFKSEGPRLYETLTWEIGCIFGIEEVLTPSLRLNMHGRDGELQAYQNSDLTAEQRYNKSLYDLVTYESYMKCALSVLLLTLYDMHNENCFYQFRREGYIQMGFWDTLMAFDRDTFWPYETASEFPSLDSPYSWIGWDFPQADRPIPKRFKPQLTQLIGTWPKRIQIFREYLQHPLTQETLTETLADKLIRRAQKLHVTILRHPDQPIRTWHEAICPQYVEAEKKLSEFFPDRDTMWILFRLRWYTQEAYGWLEEEQESAFRSWLEDFLSRG